jgi:hypothetical protein
MELEISYEELARRSGIDINELKNTETTTTTKKQRRLAEFDWEQLRRSTLLNGPTDIALTFVDYLDKVNREAFRFDQLKLDAVRFIEEVERVSGVPMSLISTNFGWRNVIEALGVISEELEQLLKDCPTLYHMAERGSWPSIRSKGLLSTSALLDSYGISGSRRRQIEGQRRPTSIELTQSGRAAAVVRDQIPIDDRGLDRCLLDGLSPESWYRLLNSKVFFWLTRERLLRLLNAGTYRALEHDVLELDTKGLVEAHSDRIWLCPMNSGCTKPYPHPRGYLTFQRIPEYSYAFWKSKRGRRERGAGDRLRSS